MSILLCVRALQLRSNEKDDMKTSVCKTIACLLPEDLEVRRACQLTEFLLEPNEETYNLLEELYLQPDQKFDEENAPVPNSLRCELLLALKAYWPFDPEFWDWKTLKRHCLRSLGKEVSESEDDLSCNEMSFNETELLDSLLSDCEESRDENSFEGNDSFNQPKERVRVKKPIGSSERYQRWLQYKFYCLICKRECIEARILHHSKMHMEDGIFTCPVCIKKFKRKDVFVTHVMEHVKMPPSRKHRAKKKILLKKERLAKNRLSRIASAALERDHRLKMAPYEKAGGDMNDYVTFSKLENCHLQDRDLYPCPGTDCTRVFKQFKYLSVHLKAEHQNNDENAMHYLDMKNKREKCSFCRRHFMSAFHLQEHEQVHSGPQPYMCVSVGCYARFGSVNELLHHKQQHDDLRYKCELNGCNIVFSDLGQLYHHEAQHFRDASYTCNFHGCKKFYYSKTEFTNHLSMHISNGEMKEAPIKHEEPVSGDNLACLSDMEGLDTTDQSHLCESFSLPSGSANSEGILQVKEEPLTDGEEGDKNNGSFGSNVAPLGTEKEVPSLTETVDHSQPIPDILLPREKVFLPSNLKEQYSNVAVYFDGKRFTCGFEGCGSTYKNSKGMQKHLRRAHPYHFKPRRKLGVKVKDTGQVNETPPDRDAGEVSSELRWLSDMNASSLGSIGWDASSKDKGYLKDEPYPSSPETSFFEPSKVSSTEDAMLELLLGLKHLSLTHSSTHSSRLSQSYSSKCPNSEDDSTSDHFTEEQRGKLPKQYLTQLAAKPFFCERQGCTCEFVTREALLTHYVRKHNYSKEMVLQLNMFRYRYSPFKCHICQRSFTRKTHLRVHYRNKHKLGNLTATQKLFADDSFGDLDDCAEDMLKDTVASMSALYSNGEEELDDQAKLDSKQERRPKKEELSSETDLESSEEAESCVTGKQAKLSALESHRKGLEMKEGRGSKRKVAKGNLCYILHKYHKPFHCIHKNCNSAFTNQKGLIRHYRTVHQYNKEQLCLEKDKARTKRELAKCKKIFVCKQKACSKRFLCSKSLAKHCSDFHNLDHVEDAKVLSETESVRFPCHHPQCPAAFYSFHKLKHHLMEEHAKEEDDEADKEIEIHCDFNGCNRVFTTYSLYSQHVFFRHGDYDGDSPEAKVKRNHFRSERERCFKHERVRRRPVHEKAGKPSKNKGKQLCTFRTKEEALRMCRDNCNQTQYPCMIQGCPSVVKLESSIVRHYKRTHQMASVYIEEHYEKLVFFVECGTVINDPCSEASQDSSKEANGDVKEEPAAPPSCPRVSEERLVLNSSSNHGDKGSRNNRCPDGQRLREASVVLYTGTLKHIYNPKTNRCFEDYSRKEPPLSKTEDLPAGGGRENGSSVQLSRERGSCDLQRTSTHQDVKRPPLPAAKDKTQKQSVPKPFDLKSFKPMGFESSFLKFIQESEEREDDDDSEDEWGPPERYDADGVLEEDKDSERDVARGGVRYRNVPTTAMPKKNGGSKAHGHLKGMQSLLPTDSPSLPSLEDLRAILDKALTDCGDHALKQLHYLRPVVVLERSKFSTSVIDFFPTKKTDQLCVGSS